MVLLEVKAENDNVTLSTSNYQAVKYIGKLKENAILFAAQAGVAGRRLGVLVAVQKRAGADVAPSGVVKPPNG